MPCASSWPFCQCYTNVFSIRITAQISACKEARHYRRDQVGKKNADSIQHDAPSHLKRAMELAQEKLRRIKLADNLSTERAQLCPSQESPT